MPLKLRQVCLATQNLEQSVSALSETLGLETCFEDPDLEMLGVRNALFQIGTDFLELVTPLHPNAPLQKFLDRQGGDCGYMVILQTQTRAEQDAIRANAAASNIAIAWELQHRGADFLQWKPADTRGCFLETSFDHAGDLTGQWSAAGGEISPPSPYQLHKLGITTTRATNVASTWAGLTGLSLTAPDTLQILDAQFQFCEPTKQSPALGLSHIHLRVQDTETVLSRARKAGLNTRSDKFYFCGVWFILSS